MPSSLPETEEAVDRFAFSVRNKGKLKGFVWVWMERVEPKKARVPQPDVIAVRVASLAEKDRLLDLDPTKFFTERTLQWVSRHSCEPADDHRPRAQATHQRGLAVPGPEGSQGMTAARRGRAGGGGQALSSTDAAVVQAEAAQFAAGHRHGTTASARESRKSGRGGEPHRAAQPEPPPVVCGVHSLLLCPKDPRGARSHSLFSSAVCDRMLSSM